MFSEPQLDAHRGVVLRPHLKRRGLVFPPFGGDPGHHHHHGRTGVHAHHRLLHLLLLLELRHLLRGEHRDRTLRVRLLLLNLLRLLLRPLLRLLLLLPAAAPAAALAAALLLLRLLLAIFAIFIGSSFRLRAADVHLAFDMSPTTKHPAPMSTKHPAGAPGTRARALVSRTNAARSQLVRARAPVRSRRIGQSTGAREAPRARWRSARGDDASFRFSLARRGHAGLLRRGVGAPRDGDGDGGGDGSLHPGRRLHER